MKTDLFNSVLISSTQFSQITELLSSNPSLQTQVTVVRQIMWKVFGPPSKQKTEVIYDPEGLRKFCIEAGAINLFDSAVLNKITVSEHSKERKGIISYYAKSSCFNLYVLLLSITKV